MKKSIVQFQKWKTSFVIPIAERSKCKTKQELYALAIRYYLSPAQASQYATNVLQQREKKKNESTTSNK